MTENYSFVKDHRFRCVIDDDKRFKDLVCGVEIRRHEIVLTIHERSDGFVFKKIQELANSSASFPVMVEMLDERANFLFAIRGDRRKYENINYHVSLSHDGVKDTDMKWVVKIPIKWA